MVFFLPSVSIQSMVTMIAAGKEKKKKDSKMKKCSRMQSYWGQTALNQSQEVKSLATLTTVNLNVTIPENLITFIT